MKGQEGLAVIQRSTLGLGSGCMGLVGEAPRCLSFGL